MSNKIRLSPSRRSHAAPTLTDVARTAAVSPMTVSRVINGKTNVRAATRERVMAAIAELKYTPNTAAQLLAGAQLTRIALLYGNPSASYLSEVIIGCLEEASRSNVQLLLEKCSDPSAAAENVKRLAHERVDGVLLPPPFSDAAELTKILTAAGIPAAVIAAADPPSDAFFVTIDDSAAALEMTRHLLGLGHRRIGFISGDPGQAASAKRLAGYRGALAEANIPWDDTLVEQGDFTYCSGLVAAERLLALGERPTAIFSSNDDMAAAAIATAHRARIRVPEDLSVCGFDDTALARLISPELTTMHQPVAEMASTAVQMLAEASRQQRAGERPRPVTRSFACPLVRRQSDAFAR